MACECVVLAETKDHFDWELIGEWHKQAGGEQGAAMQHAYERIEDEEDEHLSHTRGWCRGGCSFGNESGATAAGRKEARKNRERSRKAKQDRVKEKIICRHS